MKFGYARVSTQDQNLEIQVAKLKAAGCDEIIQETISGAKQEKPALKLLLAKLRKGDTVCVVRLDRIGRRMKDLVDLINHFKAIGVEFVALENNIDTSNAMGMLLFSMCAAFAEMERNLIQERVKAGLELAKSKGRIGGRPQALTDASKKQMQALARSGELSVSAICKMLGISRNTYYRHKVSKESLA